MNFKSLFLFVFVLMFAISSAANDKIVGIWLTQDSDSKIEIYKSTDGKYVGKIIWLKEPMENGKPRIDKNNPNEDLQTRKIMGLIILEGFKYDKSDKEWNDGTIYDPKTGNTYKCYMWFEEDDKELNVKGYIGFSLMGRKVAWTKLK